MLAPGFPSLSHQQTAFQRVSITEGTGTSFLNPTSAVLSRTLSPLCLGCSELSPTSPKISCQDFHSLEVSLISRSNYFSTDGKLNEPQMKSLRGRFPLLLLFSFSKFSYFLQTEVSHYVALTEHMEKAKIKNPAS